MATFTKIQGFVEHTAEGAHNLGSDQIVVALSNTDPTTDGVQASTAAAVLATVTEITYTNCSSRNVTTSSSAQSLGTYTLALTDLTLTASGGNVGPFRYVYVYNDTQTSPADPLIGVWDYGSSITLADTETLDIDFAASTLTIA